MSQANKEQIKAIEHQGGVLLSAGAGSGKTFVLVQHVTYIVNELQKEFQTKDEFEKALNKKFSQVVLMTFTKKATGEIAIRLKDNFRKLESGFGADSFNPWTLALKALDKLTVTTIDGFCFKLIKQGFFLNAPEAIDIMSANRSREKIYRLYMNWLEEKLKNPSESPVLDYMLRREDAVLESIQDIFSDPSLRVMWSELGKVKWTKEMVDQYLKEAVPLTDFSLLFEKDLNLSEYKTFAGTAWYKNWESIIAVLPKELSLKSILKLTTVFEGIARLTGPTKKDDLPELADYYEAIKSLREFVKTYNEDFRFFDSEFDKIILPTLNLYQEIVSYIDAHYNDLPGFVFADLAYIVHQGLMNPEAQKKVADSYSYFIVDEFQDTSFLQFSILEKLSLGDHHRIFAVGDLKQAIYGFRGGELRVFRTLGERIPQNLNLSNNYRSLPNVIHFNNHLFSLLFNKGFDFENRDLNPVPVVFQTVPEELEFKHIGSLNKILLDVPLELDEKEKPIKLRNFAMNDYEARGIIHYLKSKEPHIKGESVAILYRFLAPSTLLISKLIEAKMSFTAQVKVPFLEDPLIGIFKTLVEELLNKTMKETGSFHYSSFLLGKYLSLLGKRVDDQKLQNYIIKFSADTVTLGLKTAFTEFIFGIGLSNSNYKNNLITIHEFCDEYGADLSVLWDALNQNDDQYSFDFEYGDNPSSIVIMSAHASKGLEFEHVILAGLHTNGRGVNDSPFLGKIPGSFKWKMGQEKSSEFVTPIYWYEQLLLKHKDFSESKRLFYVAATRAQKHLVWVDFKNLELCSKVSNSWIMGLRVFENEINPVYADLFSEIKTGTMELSLQEEGTPEDANRPPFFHFDSLGINLRAEESSLLVLTEMSVTRLSYISECPRKFYLKNICKFDDDDLTTLEAIGEIDENFQTKMFREEKLSIEDNTEIQKNAMGRGTLIHATLSTMLKRNMVIPRDIVAERDIKAIDWAKSELVPFQTNYRFISEEGMKFPVFGFMMSGIPDLIIEPIEPLSESDQKDQLTKIWDFKTGKRKVDAEMNYWFQLFLYAHAQFELGKTAPEAQLELTLLYVDEQIKISKIVSYQDVRTFVTDHWKKLERLNEVNLDHCPRCPFQKLCQ